ncbi:MAG: STAS domain-containing protein [Pseudanabaenaceae cyanobacterium bins.39]|nr:STAS domain-containing protein [Pseudanabaenaceae cyanobacterium bins.39]
MDTITKVNHVSFSQDLGSKSAFSIKLTDNKLDGVSGAKLLSKIESWVAANVMMNEKSLPVLIIDMENVEFINTDGLRKLLGALRLMKAQNSNLLLCSVQPSVRLVFEISMVDQMLAILPSFDLIAQGSILEQQFA